MSHTNKTDRTDFENAEGGQEYPWSDVSRMAHDDPVNAISGSLDIGRISGGDMAELKSTTISRRCKPTHKHRMQMIVNMKLIPDIRNVSELDEYFSEEGMDRLEKATRDHG